MAPLTTIHFETEAHTTHTTHRPNCSPVLQQNHGEHSHEQPKKTTTITHSYTTIHHTPDPIAKASSYMTTINSSHLRDVSYVGLHLCHVFGLLVQQLQHAISQDIDLVGHTGQGLGGVQLCVVQVLGCLA